MANTKATHGEAAGQAAVFVHAGAHRTGTSSFQNCIAHNRPVLERAGYDLAYPGRDGARKGRLRLKLPQPRHGAHKLAEFEALCRDDIDSHRGGPDRALILSEENIPGRMMHFYESQFFPVARLRAEVLARALPGPVAHLVYVVRPYHQMFVSAYRKRAEDNAVRPFDEIAGNMVVFQGGWVETVADLQAGLQPARTTVIEYSKRGQSRTLLARLIGTDALTLEEPERSLNVSATDAALIELQRRYQAGQELKRSDWKKVIGEHAEDREDRGVAAFNNVQIGRLTRRYERTLEQLAEMPGVELIA